MYCKKCGNKLLEGSEFCQKCGTKVNETKDEKKTETKEENIVTPQELINGSKNTSSSKFDKKADEKENKLSEESGSENKEKSIDSEAKEIKKKDKPEIKESSEKIPEAQIQNDSPKKKPAVSKKTIRIIIAAVVAVILIAAGIAAFVFYQNEFTPEGKYNKGVKIYQELCSYQETNSDNATFKADDAALDKIAEGQKYFEEAGAYKDAKLFAVDFKCAGNLFAYNKSTSDSTIEVYLKQIQNDLSQCATDKLVPSGSSFTPTTDAEKLYVFLEGATFEATGVFVGSTKGADYATEYFRALESANGGNYTFAGKSSSSLGGYGLLYKFYKNNS